MIPTKAWRMQAADAMLSREGCKIRRSVPYQTPNKWLLPKTIFAFNLIIRPPVVVLNMVPNHIFDDNYVQCCPSRITSFLCPLDRHIRFNNAVSNMHWKVITYPKNSIEISLMLLTITPSQWIPTSKFTVWKRKQI